MHFTTPLLARTGEFLKSPILVCKPGVVKRGKKGWFWVGDNIVCCQSTHYKNTVIKRSVADFFLTLRYWSHQVHHHGGTGGNR